MRQAAAKLVGVSRRAQPWVWWAIFSKTANSALNSASRHQCPKPVRNSDGLHLESGTCIDRVALMACNRLTATLFWPIASLEGFWRAADGSGVGLWGGVKTGSNKVCLARHRVRLILRQSASLADSRRFESAKMSRIQADVCALNWCSLWCLMACVAASRRPATGAIRVRGDRGWFVRAGRRLAATFGRNVGGI